MIAKHDSLVELIGDLWRTHISQEYLAGRITTERCLQASLFAAVRSSMPELEVYVEPPMLYYDKGGPRYRPDLVFCRGEYIELIGEIKFMPHWYPEYLGDWGKLITIATEGRNKGHQLAIVPETGKSSKTRHQIVDKTICASFVIGRHDSDAVSAESIGDLLRAKKFSVPCYLFYGRINPDFTPMFGYEYIL